MKLKKILPIFVFTSAMLLSACSGSKNNTSEESSKEPTTSVTSKTSSTPKSSNPGTTSSKAPTSSSSKQSEHTEHNWVAGTKNGLVTPESCSCGVAGYRMNIGDASGFHDEGGKFGTREAGGVVKATWTINGAIPAGKYQVIVNCRASQTSHTGRYWYNMAKRGNENASSNPDTTSEADYRYFIDIDGKVNNPTNERSWGEDNMCDGSFVDVELINEIELKGTEKEISLAHGDIGYSVYFNYVRFVSLNKQQGGQSGGDDDKPETQHTGEKKIHLGAAPSDTSSLTANCKSYIDAMRAQINGKEDYKARTLGNDSVKIESYLDTKGAARVDKTDRSRGVNVTFSVDSGFEAKNYKIQYSTDSSFTTYLECDANPSGTPIKNLYSNTTYYWKVTGSNGVISDNNGTFTTGDYTRWIDAYELYNVRDVGGYMTSSGKRVKQGLIYRGGEITDAEWGSDHAKTVSENSKRIFRDVMGIKCEVDFRMDSQIGDSLKNTHKCHFAENGDIEYKQIYLESFSNTVNRYTSQIKQVFETFANADTTPVYFHCHGGADRTGTIGMLLLGLLGVSYTDVVIDYELTSYSSIKGGDCLRRHYQSGTYNDWPGLMNTLEGMSCWNKSNSFSSNVESFLKTKCSVSSTTIDKIRDIMIEK